jgi:hypothetical protein
MIAFWKIIDDETGQLQFRAEELQKQVADLKAECASKRSLSEKDEKNIKWCGRRWSTAASHTENSPPFFSSRNVPFSPSDLQDQTNFDDLIGWNAEK